MKRKASIMLDVVKFLASVIIIWLRRIARESKYSKLVVDIYLYGGEYANMLMLQIKNPFVEGRPKTL